MLAFLDRLTTAAALVALFLTMGCDTPRDSAASQTAPETVWDVIYMGQQAVGHQSLTFNPKRESDPSVRDAQASTVLNLQRFGETTRETMQLASRETADGQVVMVEATMQSGNGTIHTAGRRDGNTLQMTTTSGEQIHPWSLDLPPSCGGYFAIEWSLRGDPMVPGQQRQLHAVLPVLNQVAEITLTAGNRESVKLLDGSRPLLRIDQQLRLPDGTRIDGVAWATHDGEVLKSEVTSLQQVSYRVDRTRALAATEQPTFDLGRFSTVRLAQPLVASEAAEQVRYHVELRNDDPSRYFLNTAGQQVTGVDARTAEVTVRAIRPGDVLQVMSDEPPVSADQEPSAMIQSDDPVVLELAAQVRATSTDAWSRAVATERLVYETLSAKNLSTAFATAAEVARKREGDCTEHAVLTAALCRAQKIPARVLIGLIYSSAQQGFAFHMWNEVWVDGHWFPLDATAGRGGTGPTYLVLARSNLASGDSFSSLLPVIKVMGKLAIQVEEVVDALNPRADSDAES